MHCQSIPGGTTALGRLDAQERIDFIQASLRRGARRARIWAWTWAGIYSTLTAGELVLGLTASSSDTKIDDFVGAGASFVGVAVLGILPLKVLGDQRWLERRLKHVRLDEDRCAILADAERLLLRDAASEAFGSGPLVHAGSLLFNAALGVFLGAVFGHWDQAAITALTGAAVGEIQIVTQPTDVVRSLSRYRNGDLGIGPARVPPAWMLVPSASRYSQSPAP